MMAARGNQFLKIDTFDAMIDVIYIIFTLFTPLCSNCYPN